MKETAADFATQVEQRFSSQLTECICDRNEVTLVVPPAELLEVCLALRDEPEFAFLQLSDMCGIDYLSYGNSDWATTETTSTGFSRGRDSIGVPESDQANRFATVYHLISPEHNIRLRVRCFLDSDIPRVESVTSVWAGADWYEREAFDLYGILFDNHPDLRRLLTDYGFIGHPFRKDFPLEGNVEVRYDPDKQRVVYQPVTITNRVLVPRVIRDDNRYVDIE